jgi:hypothetical protein
VAVAGPVAAQGTDPDDAPTSNNLPAPPAHVDIDVAPPAPPAPTYQSNTYVAPRYSREHESTLERYVIGVALGGGVEGFTNNTMRDATNDGGGWNVRLALGTRSMIGAEVAYIGSEQSIDALGLDTSALLVGNGAEANVRFNITQTV